jgi:hypothetical protein
MLKTRPHGREQQSSALVAASSKMAWSLMSRGYFLGSLKSTGEYAWTGQAPAPGDDVVCLRAIGVRRRGDLTVESATEDEGARLGGSGADAGGR